MAYNAWVVGGINVPHVRKVSKNQKEGTITLSCSALNWNIVSPNTDVRDEIAQFEALTSQHIHNDPILNGGTKLQIGGVSEIITVTDGTDTWTRCALEEIQINEDNKSAKRIDYDLIISYQKEGMSGALTYQPDPYYSDYSNIEYYLYSDKTNPTDHGYTNNTDHLAYGNEMGWMEITETVNVRKVEVYGCGDCGTDGTDCWISLNGEKRYWHYTDSGDKLDFPGNNLDIGFEKFTWTFDTPVSVLTFISSTHVYPDSTCANNKGCWLRYIRVFYE